MLTYRDLLDRHSGRLVQKWTHYPEIYDRHLWRFRDKAPAVLEIGVAHGGSLELWREYFGIDASLFAIDKDHRCATVAEGISSFFAGSQDDADFLCSVREKLPQLDVIIDDGGHGMRQQKLTFRLLFDVLRPGGVYLCEDVHTSYWPEYGGGLRRRGTMIEMTKRLIDIQNAWHSRQQRFRPTHLTGQIGSIHYYDSVVVIEKGHSTKPEVIRVGTRSFEDGVEPKREPLVARIILGGCERFLRALRLPSIRA